jgi:predicted PurR-regulated permease PerM
VNLGQWLGLLAIVISLYILWQVRQMLLLVFAAVILATALNRLARRLQRSGMRRTFAVLLSVGIFIALIVGFFWLIVPPFIEQFQELTVRVPKGLERLNIWIEQLGTRIPRQLTPFLPDIDSLSQQARPFFNRLLGGSFAFVSGSLEFVLKFLLVLVLTGMMLANPHAYRQVFVRLFPSFYRRRVDGILHECEESLGRWLTGALISMSVVALMSMVGLSVLRIPAALALGVLAGFLNLIPNLGPTISVIPPMAIALLDSPLKPLLVLALYFVIQQIESNFLTPFVMAQQVSLLPAVTLISQVFFATFFGFLGLLLALPLTVVGKIWFREVLLEDVLDQWGRNDKRETKIVFVTESAAETESLPEESQVSQDNPNADEATKGEK